MPLISFTTQLAANASVSSGPLQLTRADAITGTVFSDTGGTAYVDQGGDGLNWDLTTTIPVLASNGTQISVPLVAEFFQVRYTNGANAQVIFRLFAEARDPYGAFLAPAQAPSPGGNWAVLRFNPGSSTYSYIGRFNAFDGFAACGNAATSTGQSGKYAAFAVTNAIVSDETIMSTTEHVPDSF